MASPATGRVRRHTSEEIVNIKARVRQRDGMRCTKCGMTNEQHLERYGKSLDVHRKKPGSLYSMRGCVTLCKGCHGPQPKRKKGQPDLEEGKEGVPVIGMHPPSRMLDALKARATRERRSIAQMAFVLLEKAMVQDGDLPTTWMEEEQS